MAGASSQHMVIPGSRDPYGLREASKAKGSGALVVGACRTFLAPRSRPACYNIAGFQTSSELLWQFQHGEFALLTHLHESCHRWCSCSGGICYFASPSTACFFCCWEDLTRASWQTLDFTSTYYCTGRLTDCDIMKVQGKLLRSLCARGHRHGRGPDTLGIIGRVGAVATAARCRHLQVRQGCRAAFSDQPPPNLPSRCTRYLHNLSGALGWLAAVQQWWHPPLQLWPWPTLQAAGAQDAAGECALLAASTNIWACKSMQGATGI